MINFLIYFLAYGFLAFDIIFSIKVEKNLSKFKELKPSSLCSDSNTLIIASHINGIIV